MTEPLPSPADDELVREAKRGNLSAMETLIGRHERRVYTLARRILNNDHDAEDTTQQVFLNVIEHLQGFREASSFATWITSIATHTALKLLRKRKAPHTGVPGPSPSPDDEPIPHPDFIADWREGPSSLAERHETRLLIEQALETLDEKHRLVFLLRDVEGLSVRETAAALDLSEANVKVRLLRARLLLRERLTRALGDPQHQIVHHHA